MNRDEHLDAWTRERSREPVPDGFADRVMAGLGRAEGGGGPRLLPALVCAAAGIVVLVRVAAVLALLLAE